MLRWLDRLVDRAVEWLAERTFHWGLRRERAEMLQYLERACGRTDVEPPGPVPAKSGWAMESIRRMRRADDAKV